MVNNVVNIISWSILDNMTKMTSMNGPKKLSEKGKGAYQKRCKGCKSNGFEPPYIGIRDKSAHQRSKITYAKPNTYNVRSRNRTHVKLSHQVHRKV